MAVPARRSLLVFAPMLRTLYVKDFAIIERAEVSFEAAMTVLTGETGAGKSLLVDALLMLAGARADAGVVRHGAERAELSADFDLTAVPSARAWLRERELDDDSALRLRRVIRVDGSSRAYINDSPVALALLREAAALLVEIHGQHEHQALLTRRHQRELLDAFGKHSGALTRIAELATRYHQLQSEIESLNAGAGSDPERREFLRFQLTELTQQALPAADYAELLARHRRLANASTLLEGAQQLCTSLDGGADAALSARLARLAGEADRLSTLDPALGNVSALLDAAHIQISEAVGELEHYLSKADLEPEQYAQIDAQIARLHDLGRKHRVPPAELAAKAEHLNEELERTEHAELRREQLVDTQKQVLIEYQQAAHDLSQQRAASAARLATAVTALLGELSIAGAFSVQLEASGEAVRGEGLDEIEFLLSPNPGQPARPLRKIASGGELARVALAIEVAAVGSDDVPVMVFDEVDSGIGGATAEVVGRKLRELGQSRQVLCVTHLPQVAAQAHQHIAVSKHQEDGATHTGFCVVSGKLRVEEIARMLGGIDLTRETRANAEQMLKRAKT